MTEAVEEKLKSAVSQEGKPWLKHLANLSAYLGEYRAGITRSRHRNRYEGWLESFLVDSTILDISQETTRHYAIVVLDLRQIGKPIPVNDLWITALCRQHLLPLVTRDRHFDLVLNLQRVSW